VSEQWINLFDLVKLLAGVAVLWLVVYAIDKASR
jgi:hypothetical protein